MDQNLNLYSHIRENGSRHTPKFENTTTTTTTTISKDLYFHVQQVVAALDGLKPLLSHEKLLFAQAAHLEPVKEHLSALQKLRKRLGRIVDTGAMDSGAITETKDYPYTAVAEAKKKLAKHLRQLS